MAAAFGIFPSGVTEPHPVQEKPKMRSAVFTQRELLANPLRTSLEVVIGSSGPLEDQSGAITALCAVVFGVRHQWFPPHVTTILMLVQINCRHFWPADLKMFPVKFTNLVVFQLYLGMDAMQFD